MSLFGTFGYKEAGLFDKYQAEHPDITIKYDSTEQEKNYWTALQTKLASGSGASDVQAIEVGRITDVAQNQGDKWLDLKGTTAGAQVANYPDWKEAAATTKDGAVLGLGTDIGPTGICYRTDLMKAAGLPTDPAELAAKLGLLGRLHRPGRAVQGQGPQGHGLDGRRGRPLQRRGLHRVARSTTTSAGQLIWNTNPAVKHAFDLVGQGRPGRPDRQARPVHPRVELGLRQGLVRHHRLPLLDDRLHQGPGRRRRQRQVERHRPCPAASAATGAARTCRSRSRASTRSRPLT